MNPRFHLATIERRTIIAALQMSSTGRRHGQQKRAAHLLGISPRVLNYKMKAHGIKRVKVDRGIPAPVVRQSALSKRERHLLREVLPARQAVVARVLESLGQ